RQWIVPPYIEWLGFGDHSERWSDSWLNGADLVALIGRETGTKEFDEYVTELREEAKLMDTPDERKMPGVCTQLFTAKSVKGDALPDEHKQMLRVFPAVGWAAIRTDLKDRERDVAMIFRSSPFGSVSHSHANNNDFILHVGGRVMAMPSGYYSGYGSDHHAHWVWHTKSHNCVTLSDAPQLMRSHDSLGSVDNAFEDDRLVYFRGTADQSYSDRAKRCRRHVIFVKEQQYFVMVDEFVAKENVASSLQWNLHSWNEYEVNEERRLFQISLGDSVLRGHFMHHKNSFFSLTEGWDPPPMKGKDHAQWHQQYHLRFTPSGIETPVRNLGVILSMGHEHLDVPVVDTERVGETEVGHVGDDLILVNQGNGIAYETYQNDALACLVLNGKTYAVHDGGIDIG
ncbi:MAG: heparinase II/III domain-containing protein, partial [Candidatus Latescibacterota bacterium]